MASRKDLRVDIMPDEVMYFGMSVSKSGAKSANVVVKKGEREYMHIGYEWEGDGIPEFVMSLMGFVKANEEKIKEVTASLSDEEKEYAKKKCGGTKKKGK